MKSARKLVATEFVMNIFKFISMKIRLRLHVASVFIHFQFFCCQITRALPR